MKIRTSHKKYFYIELENEQEHLETASSLLRDLLSGHQKNQQEILKIMNASSAENVLESYQQLLN